jgi:hypothetical protein
MIIFKITFTLLILMLGLTGFSICGRDGKNADAWYKVAIISFQGATIVAMIGVLSIIWCNDSIG